MGRPRKNSSASQGSVNSKKIQLLEGTFDIISDSDSLWDVLLKRIARTARVYGFSRIETPLLEDQNLYQLLEFSNQSLSQSPLALSVRNQAACVRVGLLPGALRAYAQSKMYERAPLSKWFYSGMVASQNPEGRLVQDYEFGLEVFGNFNHLVEAQTIGAVWEMLSSLGLEELVLEINNIGTPQCQVAYSSSLQDFLASKKYDLCDRCNEQLSGRVLNVFRCDNLDCQAVLSEAPTMLDFLDPDSHKHFTNILEALDELRIPYQLNPLYTGPEGHGKTNVVIKYKNKSQSLVIGEGGYHEELMQSICGKNFCCFGFSGSLNRVRQALELSKVNVAKEQRSDVFLVPLGELAARKSLRLFRDLIVEKVNVYDHFGDQGVKNQLKQAESFKAPIALIIGQKEAMDEMVILRDVKSGMQELISYDKIVEEVKKRLGR